MVMIACVQHRKYVLLSVTTQLIVLKYAMRWDDVVRFGYTDNPIGPLASRCKTERTSMTTKEQFESGLRLDQYMAGIAQNKENFRANFI